MFSVAWVIIQTLALWLSTVRFGSISLARSIFGTKSPQPEAFPVRKLIPVEYGDVVLLG